MNYQHGFRAGHSCTTQLVEFCHDIFSSFDSGTQVDCVFLDFRKAFDVVSHSHLLHKLSYLGLPDNVLGWVRTYLSNRSQKVIINGFESEPVPVTSGVPQGSVLGPLLFLIFINDIGANVSSNLRLYADDCVLYRDINNPNDAAQLQLDLNSIVNWCNKWNMKLNVSKCHCMRFSRKRSNTITTYLLQTESIAFSDHVKYLGLTFSSNLTWSKHTETVTMKAGRVLNFIRRNFKNAPQDVKETLYKTNVRPILEYAAAAWDPDTKVLINKLEAIQNRAARFVTGSFGKNTSVSAIKKALSWDCLQTRRTVCRLLFLNQITNGKTGINRQTYLKPPDYVSKRRDNSKKIREIHCRTSLFKSSFFPRTIGDWNKLPENIVSASAVTFDTALRDYLRGESEKSVS